MKSFGKAAGWAGLAMACGLALLSACTVVVEEEPRRYPSTIGGLCYLVILALTVLGLVVVGLGRWRGGVHVIALALAVAGVVRGVLPRRDAGMLEVRSRWFDTGLLVAAAVAVWVLASTIPDAA